MVETTWESIKPGMMIFDKSYMALFLVLSVKRVKRPERKPDINTSLLEIGPSPKWLSMSSQSKRIWTANRNHDEDVIIHF